MKKKAPEKGPHQKEGGGGAALLVGPLVEELFLQVPLPTYN